MYYQSTSIQPFCILNLYCLNCSVSSINLNARLKLETFLSIHFSVKTIPETQLEPKIKVEPDSQLQDDDGFTYVMNHKTRRQVIKTLAIKIGELNKSSEPSGNWDDSGKFVTFIHLLIYYVCVLLSK